ncbi:hypothetical protein Peur_012469 [Populus x canadensis]
MEGDGIEEGLESATGPLLLGEKSTSNTKTSNQYSITPVLVFSTFVAPCGWFPQLWMFCKKIRFQQYQGRLRHHSTRV